MKNITLALDSALHRKAKIMAAQHDMSMSKLVTFCLESMLNDLEQMSALEGKETPQPAASLVKEQAMPFKHAVDHTALAGDIDTPSSPSSGSAASLGPEGQPYQVDGKWVWTANGKPRQPGALRSELVLADDFDDWPDDIMASFADWPHDDAPAS